MYSSYAKMTKGFLVQKNKSIFCESDNNWPYVNLNLIVNVLRNCHILCVKNQKIQNKVISKPSIYIISSAVGAGACVLPIIAWNTKGDGDLSITIMFVYAIVVGFCAGVLNCLIMACTVDIFGQKRTVEVWNYVNLMLGIGFVGGPPIGAWFTSTVVSECAF